MRSHCHLFLAVVLLSLGSTASLCARVIGAALPAPEPIAIFDNSAESTYPAENPWLNPESRNGLLCHNDPVNRADPMGLFDVFIYGAGPTGPGYSNHVLTEMAQATGGQTYGRSEKAEMLRDIAAARANDPNEPINIIGYSRGAVAANQVSNELASKDTKVDKLILIDPVTAKWERTREGTMNVSKNASEATVYSQKNGGPFPGTRGTAAPNVKNIDKSGSTHRSIPRDVKTPILEKLKNGR